jgi:hypothetical protein
MIERRGNKHTVRVWNRAQRKMVWVGTYDSRAEAQDAEARATLKPRRGAPIAVRQWAEMWRSDYARPAAATQRNYCYGTERIAARIGDLRLSEVDRPLARKLGHEWPRDTMRTARTMFGDAMRDGLIEFNPFSDLRLETPRGRKDIYPPHQSRSTSSPPSRSACTATATGQKRPRSSSRSAIRACDPASCAVPGAAISTGRQDVY